MTPYTLYILFSESLNRYYVGISHDAPKRAFYHNLSQKGWTQRGRPWRLVFQREFPSRAIAQKWERWIKRQKSRQLIEKIIRGEFSWDEECISKGL